MQTTNERLRDQKIAHALAVLRYGAGLSKTVVTTLNSADVALRDKLAQRLTAIEERGLDIGPKTTKRLRGLIDELGEINADVYAKAANDTFDELADFGLSEGQWEADSLTHSLTIDYEAKVPSPAMLKAIAEEQPMQGILLKDTFSGMEAARMDRITQVIRTGMIEGRGTDQIVRNVVGTKAQAYQDGILNKSRQSADAIVRTAVNHVSNVAAQSTWAANSDVVKGWQFVATLDSRTTITCAGLNGHVYQIGQGPMPPRHVRCRSITVAVTKSFRELGLNIDELPPGTRASMDGQIAGDITFDKWLESKGTTVQDKILGSTRAKIFRDGKLDLAGFIKSDGTVLTLDQLKRLHPTAFE
jgi:SPP1 gp7 family putative phage head morphogenesis protein